MEVLITCYIVGAVITFILLEMGTAKFFWRKTIIKHIIYFFCAIFWFPLGIIALFYLMIKSFYDRMDQECRKAEKETVSK